jgi:hypothetical protein
VRNGKNWAETGYFSKIRFLASFCQFGPHYIYIKYMYIWEGDDRNGKNWAETGLFPN